MHTDAHGLRVVLLEIQIKGFDNLVKCSLGGAVRVPPAALVVLYRSDARRYVGPFRHIREGVVVNTLGLQALTLGVHPARGQEPREVFNDQEMRDDINLKSLLQRIPIQVRGLLFWDEHPTRNERRVDERVGEVFLLERLREGLRGASDTGLGCKVEPEKSQSGGIYFPTKGFKNRLLYRVVGRRGTVGGVHWEVGGAEELAGESDAETACGTWSDEDERVEGHGKDGQDRVSARPYNKYSSRGR